VTVASLAEGEVVTTDDALLRDLIVEGTIIFDMTRHILFYLLGNRLRERERKIAQNK
jgi:hypothetical protein